MYELRGKGSDDTQVSILYKSTAGRYRPVSYPDGPITACCRFIKNASWDFAQALDDENPYFLHMLRGSFLLDSADLYIAFI